MRGSEATVHEDPGRGRTFPRRLFLSLVALFRVWGLWFRVWGAHRARVEAFSEPLHGTPDLDVCQLPPHHQPSAWEQTVLVSPLICTRGRRNPTAFSINQGD